MTKLINPMMSLGASGTFANAMVFAKNKGVSYVRNYAKPKYTNTAEQAAIRDIVRDASVSWKLGSTVGGVAINSAYKLAYDAAKYGNLSGFNLFIKECIQKNGGTSYTGTLEIPSTPGDVL